MKKANSDSFHCGKATHRSLPRGFRGGMPTGKARRWYGEDAGGGWEGCLEGVEVRCGEGGWVGGGGGGVERRRGVLMGGVGG